ncbi:matrixin family metalloprotease [Lentilactobacillus kisonensis]|uniref:Matrixin n=1 Tax=Lentilactobacillus kisonensis F0435 TaxID=797516 RepID=H1LCJ2_9LACO|nr:matrixin family metalloprotease [Lentilactobacillus kisonensis]EHO53971.1 Matrixin [Lentilactobacillus kisonensis F0435]
MKWLNRLVAVIVVALTINVFVQPDAMKTIGKQITNAVDMPAMLISHLQKTATLTRQTESSTSRGTPIEGIVADRQLSNHYYYRFEKDVPVEARRVFAEAVEKYNQTGIVKILPLANHDNHHANEMTFYVYRKRVSAQSSAVELGLGGPKIYPLIGAHHDDLNQGRAGLNIEYPQLSVRLSVAMHEIGHVLGLDHSLKRSSIMFPVDQGKTTLSSDDLATLRKIYRHHD